MLDIFELLPAAWKPVVMYALAWIGALRLLIKPLGNWLKGVITAAAERASLTLDREDDTVIEYILRARSYRIFAFLLDLFASVKLPAAEDLFKPNPNDRIRSI